MVQVQRTQRSSPEAEPHRARLEDLEGTSQHWLSLSSDLVNPVPYNCAWEIIMQMQRHVYEDVHLSIIFKKENQKPSNMQLTILNHKVEYSSALKILLGRKKITTAYPF